MIIKYIALQYQLVVTSALHSSKYFKSIIVAPFLKDHILKQRHITML